VIETTVFDGFSFFFNFVLYIFLLDFLQLYMTII
jgi:hypothetical protein